jgi:undecaprenyl diphosphate synthase
MLQNTRTQTRRPAGIHVGVIMDGNGRWATARGRPRTFGHKAGADAVRRVVEAAPDQGIRHLTLYAFSSDNWARPTREVTALMRLLRSYLASETARCVENGVRLSVIGRRDRLSPVLVRAIEAAERATAGGDTLHLRLAIDYSARDTLVRAAQRLPAGAEPDREALNRLIAEALHSPEPIPEVDLLVRTGGEQRLSDFLLRECAYAELYFTPCPWPDFDGAALAAAVAEFGRRQRRFGGLTAGGVNADRLTAVAS